MFKTTGNKYFTASTPANKIEVNSSREGYLTFMLTQHGNFFYFTCAHICQFSQHFYNNGKSKQYFFPKRSK